MRIYTAYKKLALAVVLILIYFLNTFQLYIPYLQYEINYQYISQSLCKNIETPALECHWKCFLSKELKKAAKEESSGKKTLTKVIQLDLLFSDKIQFYPVINYLVEEHNFHFFKTDIKAISLNKITPPPKACLVN